MRLDVLGIPSSLFWIYLAGVVHRRFIVPYGPVMRQEMIQAAQTVAQIVQQRVWLPAKGIYDDIMNKSPSMMSALGLYAEETSLDHMLRDLGFGDGTSQTRREALQKATEQYEHDLSHGLLANFVRGRLIRLLLIQVQQLKVGMLSALDTIDVLMQGNRIHFNVLAAIPAVVIATYGTRYFIHSMYNIRAQDLRPVGVVHGEMTQYLINMESLLLLAAREGPSDSSNMNGPPMRQWRRNSSTTTTNHRRDDCGIRHLRPVELGELVLHAHRYLTLLDFSSFVFPVGNCDAIHHLLQQFLGVEGVLARANHGDSDRSIAWLNRIQQKHHELSKFL